jgi:APA family basic amino acid/polyamine antiporter
MRIYHRVSITTVPSQPRGASAVESGDLSRQLGLGAATAAVAGEAIAVGIFLTPASMAQMLGSPALIFLVWIAMGVTAAFGALCYGDLASRFPAVGGAYIYLRESYGEMPAFLYGWMSLLVMDPGLTAALAIGLTSYVAYIVPIAGFHAKLLGLGVVCLLAIINMLNARAGAALLQLTTWLKISILALLPLWAMASHAGRFSNMVPLVDRRPGSPPLLQAVAGATMAAFFSFGGWWDASKLAGEVRDPQRTLPRAFILGVSLVTLVYMMVSGAFLYVVPLEKVTSDLTFVSQFGNALFGRWGARLLAAIVALCVLGSLSVLMMAAPRAYFAMARDGVFLKSVGRTNTRFGTPERAICMQAALASIFILVANFEAILGYFMFPTVMFVGLTVATIFKHSPERWRFTAATVFIVFILAVLTLVAIRAPLSAALGTGIVLAGIPFWLAVKARRPEKR